jgi:uncharacterized membrane protein YbhN (UPF0104 family)
LLRPVAKVLTFGVALGAAAQLVDQHGADLRRLPATLAGARPGWVALALWAEAASMAAAARQQRRLLASAGVRMPLRRALRLTLAANAVSVTLPAGTALAVVYQQREYRRHGATPGAAIAVALVGGALSADALVAIGCVGVLLTGGALARWHWLAALLFLGSLAFAVGLGVALRRGARPERRHTASGRLAALAARLLRDARALRPGAGAWAAAVAASVANWLTDGVCFAASAHAVGLRVPVAYLVTGYCVGQVLISAPVVPGGLGIAESGMTAVLIGFGAGAAGALSAVLLYRLISYWLLVGVGAACAARLGRGGRENPQMRNSTVDPPRWAA